MLNALKGGRQRDGLMCSKEDQLRDHLHAPEGPRQRHSRNQPAALCHLTGFLNGSNEGDKAKTSDVNQERYRSWLQLKENQSKDRNKQETA
ncbi:hypothetical protein RB195_007769 [Necator americanus]|uniref:Uncharacterized protein n=1 Tax=Necator americanus TaxID=51031 RepID=A0ABR1C000_NECAM